MVLYYLTKFHFKTRNSFRVMGRGHFPPSPPSPGTLNKPGPDRVKSTWWQKRGNSVALLDLSAAFDTIDHEIPVARLRAHFEFTGKVVRWFTSYLQDRCQIVVIAWKCKIGSQHLSSGVPHGSVFGPLLFILLRPSWRSDQISRPWLHVVCWWLAALHHNEASWETHGHSQPRTMHFWYSDIHLSQQTLRRQKSSTCIPDTRTVSQWSILLSVIISYLSATKPTILALYLTNTQPCPDSYNY